MHVCNVGCGKQHSQTLDELTGTTFVSISEVKVEMKADFSKTTKNQRF